MSKFNCGNKVMYDFHHCGLTECYVVKVSQEATTRGDPFSEEGLSKLLYTTRYDLKYKVGDITFKKHGVREKFIITKYDFY